MAGAQTAHHPAQEQDRQPGLRSDMVPKPRAEMRDYRAAGKLEGKAALITGGDSGIGRAVAIGCAKEGADVAIVYLDEHEGAASTRMLVEQEGRRRIMIAGDIGDEAFCKDAVARTIEAFGRLDLLVNNAGEQHPHPIRRRLPPGR
jgi:NAD(P)-dependent dehydrogenase (short-subunit alcohol dehydrogenase family)